MRLVTFTVRNYRSIVEAYKLQLGNYTVLVGPNNEGKSNLLKAIVLGLTLLTRGRARIGARWGTTRYYRSGFDFDYDWERDFPVSLQVDTPGGRSEFTLEFSLDEAELLAFRKKVGANLSSNLKVKLLFGQDDVGFEVLIQGPAKRAFNQRRPEIAEFIRERISAQYISAVRPSDMAGSIVDGVIERELATLEEDKSYQQLLDQLENLQQPILSKIAERLKESIAEFVLGIRGVQLVPEGGLGRAIRRSYRVMIDDGVMTDLSLKGDGVISLTTIALMRFASQESLGSRSLVLSIEEPESHLHPRSIHAVRQVLKDISAQHQVIITTHSPLLVEREAIRQNVLVLHGKARRARKIDDIREALGIQLSDNLVGAYLVLMVEGEEDKDIIETWLRSLSPTIATALRQRTLLVDHLAGASNLAYKASFYKQNVCNIHAFLDSDRDGRAAVRVAIEKGLLEEGDYHLSTCRDMADSEIEDLITLDTYCSSVQDAYGVSLNHPRFRSSSAKWSDRVADIFHASGKLWDKHVKSSLKRHVANAVAERGLESLCPHRRECIVALAQTLENKLRQRTR